MKQAVRIGTRGSQLALWQASWVQRRLTDLWPEVSVSIDIIKTTGDAIQDTPLAKIGDKGLFTRELDRALLEERVDLVVHSLKDVPTELVEGIATAAIPEREDPRDIFFGKTGARLEELPRNAVVGTGSLRRRAQLLALRPDFRWTDLRGNIDTRLRKLRETPLDGIILALAGVRRLELDLNNSHVLDLERWLPAPGQGALAIQVRSNDRTVVEIAASLEHTPTRRAVTAERAVLARLEGGCHVPMGVYARVEEDELVLNAFVADVAGTRIVRGQGRGAWTEAERVGDEVGRDLLARGGAEILAALKVETDRDV